MVFNIEMSEVEFLDLHSSLVMAVCSDPNLGKAQAFSNALHIAMEKKDVSVINRTMDLIEESVPKQPFLRAISVHMVENPPSREAKAAVTKMILAELFQHMFK